MARSFRDRLSIRTNSSTRSLRRALSIKQYLLCSYDPFGRNAGNRAAVRSRSESGIVARNGRIAGVYQKTGRQVHSFFPYVPWNQAHSSEMDIISASVWLALA